MAERKGITSVSFWEACYMDEKEKNIDLKQKLQYLKGMSVQTSLKRMNLSKQITSLETKSKSFERNVTL